MSKRFNYYGSFPSFENLYSSQVDGVNEIIVMSSSTAYFKWLHGAVNPTTFTFSIGLWVKFNNFSASQEIFSSAGNVDATIGIRMAINTARVITIRIYNNAAGTGTGVCPLTSSGFYPNDTDWHFILLTYDQSLASNNMRLYVDNTQIGLATKTANAPSTANSTHDFRFANNAGAGGVLFMNGKIFHPIIANKVVSSTERTEWMALLGASANTLSFAANVTDAWHYPNGQADYPVLTRYIGSINGTLTNMEVADIQTDVPV